MRTTYLIVSDSTNIQDSNLGHIKVTFPKSIDLPVLANNKKYKIELEYLKLPYSVYNISSAKANNKIVYTYSATPYTITFPDGVYTSLYLSSYIQSYLEAEGHYETHATTYAKTYYFELVFNNAMSKSILQVNKSGCSITGFDSSTFYSVIGFALAQLPVAVTTTSTNLADIAQSSDEFFLHMNIAKSNYNTSLGGSNIIYNSAWAGNPWTYSFHPLPEEHRVSTDLRTESISEFEIRITDSSNNLMTFGSSTTIDSLVMRFSITDKQ